MSADDSRPEKLRGKVAETVRRICPGICLCVLLTAFAGGSAAQFTQPGGSPFGTGSSPISVTAGDFNSDGIPDLAIANFGDNTVTVLLGNGTGGFTAASGSPFPAGTNPQSITVADVNHDGIFDIAVANNGSGNVTVLLGSGTGSSWSLSAAPGSPFGAGANTTSVTVGDFNGDGNPDLAVTNSGDNTVTILLGTGAGGFTAAGGSPLSVSGGPFALANADFNGDGKLDLAVVGQSGNDVTVLLGALSSVGSTLGTTAASSITQGTPVPLTLTLSSSGLVFNPPTGIAIFLDGTTALGTSTQTASPYSFTPTSLANGSHTFSATYPGDARNTPSSSNSITIQVASTTTTATVTLGGLAATYTGSPISATATTSPSGLAVAFTYNNSSTPPTAAGSYTVVATIDSPNYTGSATGRLVISKASPVITWPAPAAITFGSALSSVQLNATASVPGTFVYTPAAGTVLQAGNGQVLSVTFTPTNTTNYTTANATTTITVNQAPPSGTPANLVVTHTLARTNGNIVVTLTIANTGGTAAANVSLTALKIGTTSGAPLPQSLGTIAAGGTAQVTVTVPGSAGASGASGSLTLSGTYSGGTFSSSGRITLP